MIVDMYTEMLWLNNFTHWRNKDLGKRKYDTILGNNVFKTTNDQQLQEHHRGLAWMVQKYFNKKTKTGGVLIKSDSRSQDDSWQMRTC